MKMAYQGPLFPSKAIRSHDALIYVLLKNSQESIVAFDAYHRYVGNIRIGVYESSVAIEICSNKER